MRCFRWLTLLVLVNLSLSCADTAPASISFTAPPPVIASGKTVRLDAALANKKGEPIAGTSVTYTAAPADVLEIVAGEGIRCLKSGDATVTLAGGGLSQP